MADTPISGLNAISGAAATAADEFAVVNAAETKKISLAELKTALTKDGLAVAGALTGPDGQPWVKSTDFGYSASYKAVQIGGAGAATENVALAVDPSAIAGSSFDGSEQVIVGKNGVIVPNNAATDFIGVWSRSASDSILLGPAIIGGKSSGPVEVTASGLAVTGNLSATGIIASQNAGQGFQLGGGIGNAYLYHSGALQIGTQTGQGPIRFQPDTTTVAEINSTGLAVTGNLSATGSRINFANLPTSVTGLTTGDLWNDGGTLKIAP